jgi:cyclomaltodextrinase
VPARCFEYLYSNCCDVFKVPAWAQGAAAYQIFPERFFNGDASNDPEGTLEWGGKPTRTNFFGGDLKGVIEKLDYICSLGADVLYLNPIFTSPSNHKYDTADYYTVDPVFGTIGDLKALTQACHNKGVRVILDGVFNHCGYEFGPFQDVLENGERSKYKDWFYIDGFPVVADPPNYECVGYYKWMPKINFSSRKARDYFLNVGVYWIKEAGIDGWRLDVADEADFTFWQEFRRAVKSASEDAILIGETWKDGRDLLRGDEMDSVMNYLFRDAAVDFFAKQSISAVEFDDRVQRMLSMYPLSVYPVLYNLIGSHDTERFLTLCGGDKQRMKLAVAFQMTFPGMPAVYYGDETGMDGETDPDCRKAMNWDSPDADMYEFYKRFIALRRSEPCLKSGDVSTLLCCEGCYAFARRCGGESVYAAFNNSGEKKTLTIPLYERAGVRLSSLLDGKVYTSAGTERSAHYGGDVHEYGSEFKLVLPAYRFDVIKTWRN